MFSPQKWIWFVTITFLSYMKTSNAVSLTSNAAMECAIMLRNCQSNCNKGGRVIAIHWSISILKGTLACNEKMSEVPDPSKPEVESPMTASFDVPCCKDQTPTERSSNQRTENCTTDFAGMVNLLLLQEEKQEETLRLLSKDSTSQLKSQIHLVTIVAGATMVWVIVCCVMVLLNMIHRKRMRASVENKVEKKKENPSKWKKDQEKTTSTVVTIFDSETKSDSSGDFTSTTPHFRGNGNTVNHNNQNSNQNRLKVEGHTVIGGFIVPTSPADDVTNTQADVSEQEVVTRRVIVKGEFGRQAGKNSGQSHREFNDDYVEAPPLKSSQAPTRVIPPQYNTLIPSSVDAEDPDYTKLQRDGAPNKTLVFKDTGNTEETTA